MSEGGWLIVLLVCLATWRISRIVVAEDGPFDVLARLRAKLRVNDQATWIQRGLACVACVSFWIGLVLSFWIWRVSMISLLVGLTASAVSVILAKKVG